MRYRTELHTSSSLEGKCQDNDHGYLPLQIIHAFASTCVCVVFVVAPTLLMCGLVCYTPSETPCASARCSVKPKVCCIQVGYAPPVPVPRSTVREPVPE